MKKVFTKIKLPYLTAFVAGILLMWGLNAVHIDFNMPSIAALWSPDSSGYTYNPNIDEGTSSIWNDKNALYSYVKKFGPKDTIQQLHNLGYGKGFGDCHQNAHETGRISYEVYGDKAFQLCSSECHSGCYHGATEAYFKDKGTANLVDNLKTLCRGELNAFFSHQCIHGIGHGLMAWTNYEMFDALESCDLLPERKDSCWTGVFMENIVGGLAKADVEKKGESDMEAAAHFTKYLNNDPLYPCDDPNLKEIYKGSCYFLQTSRMVQLFNSDFSKVAKSCSAAPAPYQRSCFESMGRDVGGVFRNDSAGALKACSNAPYGDMRIGCLIGAAQDAFWDPSGQDHALGFCKLLSDKKEKEACYNIIFSRAPEILSSKSELAAFCAKSEKDYQALCRNKTGV